MNDGTFDGAMSAINGHERTGFIVRVKFRKGFFCFFFLPRQEKKALDFSFRRFILNKYD
jgi:hypothetical protein